MKTKSHQATSIITSRNIFVAFTIAICLHAVLLLYAFLCSSSDNNYLFYNSSFFLFTLSDIVLWIVCLIPLVAIFRGKLAWHDAYALASSFSFFFIVIAYPGYIIDPYYIFYRIFTFFPEHSTVSNEILLARLAESELLFTIFLSLLLFTNHCIPRALSLQTQKLYKLQSVPIVVTGVILLTAGLYGFVVSYRDIDYFQSIIFQVGESGLKTPESGQARFLMLVNIATLFFPLFWVTLILHFLRKKILTNTIKFISILSIGIPLIPLLIYGARASIIMSVMLFLLLVNRHAFVIKSKLLMVVVLIMIILVYGITALRFNPNIYGYDSPQKILYGIITGNIMPNRENKIGVFFDSDRIITAASLIQYVNQSGDMILGRSLLSSPIRIANDILRRVGFGDDFGQDSWWSAGDFAKYWRFGSLNTLTGTPPSLPAEFYLQLGDKLGYLSLIILSIIYGKALYLLRKKMIRTSSLISYFFLAVITVNQLVIIGADISYIFGVLFYQLLPILIVYRVVAIFIPAKYKESTSYENKTLISPKQV